MPLNVGTFVVWATAVTILPVASHEQCIVEWLPLKEYIQYLMRADLSKGYTYVVMRRVRLVIGLCVWITGLGALRIIVRRMTMSSSNHH